MRVRSPPRASTDHATAPSAVNRPRAYGLRLRLIALVLAAVAPLVFLIAMVARQHRFNERSAAEERALDQAGALADRLGSRFGSIDLVLTDLVMPAMSGRELVDALRSTRPDVRVVYMSGYTDDDIVRRGLHDPTMSFIQKPFTAENLAMQVRKVLDAAA
jgi:CheY-like chemotaxis protein